MTTPFTENPQLAEIRRLEADLSNKTNLAQQYERHYNEEKAARAADRANYHGRAVVGWVKSILRILLVLIWFGVVIAGVPFPIYMNVVRHTDPLVYWSWFFPFIYLHDKE